MVRFQGLFSGKMNSLKIKHLKKIHFLVPEYDNLTGVKTDRDKLGIRGKALWNRGFKFLVLEGVDDVIIDSGAVQSLPFHSSVCFARESLNFLFLL